MFKERA